MLKEARKCPKQATETDAASDRIIACVRDIVEHWLCYNV
jgi:hypothetical protein